ncbi:hypothetical protein SLS62_004745 [Diatrype stigma]|uniref:Microbial-type PARG catalytic domain-containing protein n=1 Tax=Diatrype stigma TaxID=117547 RepID=A0AAN9UTQ4_9PEZI
MGRMEPSLGRPPAGFRRDARAKKAKATVNKVIPSLLSAHPRARKGIESAELIVDPPPPPQLGLSSGSGGGGDSGKKRAGSGAVALTAAAASSGQIPKSGSGMRITMRLADTLTVAHSLLLSSSSTSRRTASSGEGDRRKQTTKMADLANREARVGILNMASPLSPGGGFLNGSAAQEESLCMRATLLPSLRDEFYRLPELGAVYTPDVLVFRDEHGEDLQKKDRWFVDCISAAMLRIPETQDVVEADRDAGREGEVQRDGGGGGGCHCDDDNDNDEVGDGRGGEHAHAAPPARLQKTYADPRDRELVIRKMRVVLRIAQAKGIRRLVLGAWGCGAYNNPVEEIAAAWKKVLLGGSSRERRHGNANKKKNGGKEEATWAGIEEVVFAIKGGGIAERFERAFGDGLIREEEDAAVNHEDGNAGPSGGAADREDDALRELREKIQQLELQVQQARTPQLKSGLGSVLAGLRSQLPEDQAPSSDHDPLGSEDDEDDEDEWDYL